MSGDRYPGYDVLAKRGTPSWNAPTRRVVDARLALTPDEDALDPDRRATLAAVIDRIAPQPEGRPPVNALAILLEKIGAGAGDGYRHHALPPLAEAWRRGLAAIDAEAIAREGSPFVALGGDAQDAVLHAVEQGDVRADAWRSIDPAVFFAWRLLPDIVSAYWAHPSAWSAMGFGGPASPRGYVRLALDRRDPWEAPAEARTRDDR